jgi:hypothetical protein
MSYEFKHWDIESGLSVSVNLDKEDLTSTEVCELFFSFLKGCGYYFPCDAVTVAPINNEGEAV